MNKAAHGRFRGILWIFLWFLFFFWFRNFFLTESVSIVFSIRSMFIIAKCWTFEILFHVSTVFSLFTFLRKGLILLSFLVFIFCFFNKFIQKARIIIVISCWFHSMKRSTLKSSVTSRSMRIEWFTFQSPFRLIHIKTTSK